MKRSIIFAAALAFATPALAEAEFEPLSASDIAAASISAQTGRDVSPFSIGLGVSVFGPSLEARYAFTDKFAVRGNIAEFSVNHEEESRGETYSGDFEMGGTGVWLDYHPFGGAFRLSGGGFMTDISGTLSSSDVEIGGITSRLNASVESRTDFMPAVAIGFDKQVSRRLSFSMDAGALFGDGFKVSASDPTGTFTQAQVDSEISDLASDLEDLDVVPYLRVGLAWRF
ncbi:hypothetical protein AB9K35_07745 [Leisingera sp. XS_AS12]|uniref:hypothetical protein n=1 Tax=Leisingera sp. XS_AS12 TaxID=3241294 RepID=UPI00351967EA